MGMRVELLIHPGCRSGATVHHLVQDCLAVLSIETPVHVQIGAYASPTVLVDGADVMDPVRGMPSGHMCRLDLPTRERLLTALTARYTGDPDLPAGKTGPKGQVVERRRDASSGG
jgi:hypothetical protein